MSVKGHCFHPVCLLQVQQSQGSAESSIQEPGWYQAARPAQLPAFVLYPLPAGHRCGDMWKRTKVLNYSPDAEVVFYSSQVTGHIEETLDI